MWKTGRRWLRSLRGELDFYRRLLRHPRTPRAARCLLGAAIGYAISPVDLIPDWIPVVGYLDDLLIVPALVFVALRLIPKEVIAECRRDSRDSHTSRS